ncbi:MAG: hypothetical protein UT50_C0001G0085 [Candidatus Moranbacteria bacterium GW2011_GWA2_39_41]|nr:MAG: hypothetical protein UT50_C0001G0085 [Candidatus Moranbacteria bacterium GW2011_GWA2_39_41]
MVEFFGTEIFWITLLITMAILTLVTFVGYMWCELLPDQFKNNANFFLSPAIGLATLTIIASIIGRVLPLGSQIIMIFSIIILLALIFIFRQHLRQIFKNSLIISIFGIFCGIGILVPLFLYGAFDSHNDAFTYLAHSEWLQSHAFKETISIDNVTPVTTQISLYQASGFRMGGSFLLALMQSLFNLHWSYEIYPAIIIVAITACCLAIGFPIAQIYPNIRRKTLLVLISLPSFSLGGLIFGASFGFLPQMIGLTLGINLLIIIGFLFNWIAINNPARKLVIIATFPCSLFLVGVTFAYSEILPFISLAILISGFIIMVRFRVWKNMLTFGSAFFGASMLMLNMEIIRAYSAIRAQTSAVVGSPVEWSLLGYIAHAFGVHGGAWDIFQWTNPGYNNLIIIIFASFLLTIMIGVVFLARRPLKYYFIDGILMPIIILLCIFIAGIIYFRHFVQSPFPTGTGQSWSQFKLSDWAHPFIMSVVLFSFVAFQKKIGKKFHILILLLFIFGLMSSIYISIDRINPLVQYYGKTRNLNQFYINFRKKVSLNCPQSSTRVYLDLHGKDLKFRQLATLYLSDREVISNWMDDGYIYGYLPIKSRNKDLKIGDCLVESFEQGIELKDDEKIGPFRVKIFNDSARIKIISIVGAYERESDGEKYWNWVKNNVIFEIQSTPVSESINQTRLFFRYKTIGVQNLNLSIIDKNNISINFILNQDSDTMNTFDNIIDLSPTDISKIIIKTDGEALRLSKKDSRKAAFLIQDIKIQPQNKFD